MAAHIEQDNGKPVPKTYTFSSGVFRLYEKLINQVTTYKNEKLGSYLMLGFGASGKDLADKWNITYAGTETINGVKTERLELIAKDPAVRKNLVKVTVWMDTTHGVSLKQVFDEGQGLSRVSTYSNFKFNQALPGDAFKIPTDSKTQYVNR
jgi:outer membrane lipoprotein-sorting protein